MIRQRIEIPCCDWLVDIIYDAHPRNAGLINRMLHDMGCSRRYLPHAAELLTNDRYNEGLTYSNRRERHSLIVVERTTDMFEFIDTLSHEKKHLEQAICQADELDPYGEEIAYISGHISQAIARNAWMNMRKIFLYLI